MVVLVFIAPLFLIAFGLMAVAMRESRKVEERWRTFAQTIGGVYTPRGKGRRSSTIDFVRGDAAIQFFVFVGWGVLNGVRTPYNSLRATATPAGGVGRTFHMLYQPSLEKEPLLFGDDTPETREWLAPVGDLIKSRPGSQLFSDGTTLTVDLARKKDAIADFEMMTECLTRLVTTQHIHAPSAVPFVTNAAPPATLQPAR